MNFGAFAGGFSQGFNNGLSMAKSVREIIRERKLQDLREQGMAEAEAARQKQVNDMIREQGMPEAPAAPAPAPAPAPVQTVPAPQAVEVRPLGPPPGQSASPTESPDAASAATAASGERPSLDVTTTVDGQPVQVPKAEPARPPAQAPAVAPAAAPAAAAAPAQPPGPAQSVAAKGVTGPGFWVNGQRFDTREQARAAAEKSAPSAMDLFLKNSVPKLAAEYVAQGQPEKAKAWTDYAESAAGKRAIKDWAAAYAAPDFDTAAARFGKYYTEHINDGVDYVGHKMLTKEDGTQIAVVSLKDKASGKTTEMEVTRDRMIQLGAANNPQRLFETEHARMLSAEKTKIEATVKARERREKLNDALAIEDYKQNRLDEREKIKGDRDARREREKTDAKIDAQVESLRDAGYSDDDIKRMMPALVGAADHKKTTDPTERRALIASDLLKNDPRFSRLSREEQNKRIDDMMGVIYGETSKQPAKASSVADKPMPYNKDLPVKYRKSDGKPFHYVNGQYVPIEGTVPPAASGLPKP